MFGRFTKDAPLRCAGQHPKLLHQGLEGGCVVGLFQKVAQQHLPVGGGGEQNKKLTQGYFQVVPVDGQYWREQRPVLPVAEGIDNPIHHPAGVVVEQARTLCYQHQVMRTVKPT